MKRAIRKNIVWLSTIVLVSIIAELILSRTLMPKKINDPETLSLALLIATYVIVSILRAKAFQKRERTQYINTAGKLLAIFVIIQAAIFIELESSVSRVIWSSISFSVLILSDYIMANTLRKKSIQNNQNDGE